MINKSAILITAILTVYASGALSAPITFETLSTRTYIGGTSTYHGEVQLPTSLLLAGNNTLITGGNIVFEFTDDNDTVQRHNSISYQPNSQTQSTVGGAHGSTTTYVTIRDKITTIENVAESEGALITVGTTRAVANHANDRRRENISSSDHSDHSNDQVVSTSDPYIISRDRHVTGEFDSHIDYNYGIDVTKNHDVLKTVTLDSSSFSWTYLCRAA